MSDRSDFWSLYDRVAGRALEPVALIGAELAGPLWQLGARWYDFVDDTTALAIATERGRSRWCASISPPAPTRRSLCPRSSSPASPCAGGRALVQALPADAPAEILLLDPATAAAETRSPPPARLSAWTRPRSAGPSTSPSPAAMAGRPSRSTIRRPIPTMRRCRASCRRWSCAAMAAPRAAPRRR
ncbi:MAG: hypothetical protein U1E52_00540 [Geminicoccaceae bacterium]